MNRFFKLSFLFSIVAILFVFTSCKKQEKTQATDAVKADSLQHTFITIQDSLNLSWHKMIADDDQKIADAKRLLEEISYTNKYNAAQYDSLQEDLKKLKEIRYNNSSMSNSAEIDDYDSASNLIMNEIIMLATNHPDYKRYPLMKELVSDIQQANGRVLRYRVNYDFSAKQYNQFLEDNEGLLNNVDSLQGLEKKPLFELES